MENFTERKTPAGLYSPRFEHDNCGIGAVVDIKGRKSHKTIDDALQIVEHLEHRAGKDAEGKTGDGGGHHAADQPPLLCQGGRRAEHPPWQRARIRRWDVLSSPRTSICALRP